MRGVLERLQACGCTASKWDGLTCGTVVSTTAQDNSVTKNHTMEEAAGGCADAQAAPKVHHSKVGLHPSKNKPVSHTGQHNDPRSAGESIVEDLAVVAQPQLEDVEEICPHVLEEEIPRTVISGVTRPHQPEGISPQHPVEMGSQEVPETLNVLVKDGSSVDAYTLDLIAPPKSTSEITQLPTL